MQRMAAGYNNRGEGKLFLEFEISFKITYCKHRIVAKMTAAQVLNLNRRYCTLNTSITIMNGIDLELSSRGEITQRKLF